MIKECLIDRENVLKNKIESVLDKEIDYFQNIIDKINEKTGLIKKMKHEKDNLEYLNEFDILQKSRENNENLKEILNKPPLINRDVIFYELKKEDELIHIKKIISDKFLEENNNSSSIGGKSLSNSANSEKHSMNLNSKKSAPSSNFLINEIKKLEKKSKNLVETKSNININPKNNLNAARENIKSNKNSVITTSYTQQPNVLTTNNKNQANVYPNNSSNLNNSVNPNKIRNPNSDKSQIQKRNKTPTKSDKDNYILSSNIKNDTNTNITTSVSTENYTQDKLESESFNFVGKTGEKEPPKSDKQKTMALFPALKSDIYLILVKISNQRNNKMNSSDIEITDGDNKKEEVSPSFRNQDSKLTYHEGIRVNLNDTTNHVNCNKKLDDETIKLDLSIKHPKDNLYDSSININGNNISQLQCSTQSMNTDLASLYKSFNYSILLLGGKPDGSVRKLELETKSWKEIRNLIIDKSDFCAIMYKEKKILLIGGKTNETVSDTIELLNMDEMAIKKLDIKLKTPRSNFGAVYINSKLFVAGGYTIKEALNSFEYFDKKTKVWNDLQKMNFKRKEFNMIVGPDNSLYALGGTDEKEYILLN